MTGGSQVDPPAAAEEPKMVFVGSVIGEPVLAFSASAEDSEPVVRITADGNIVLRPDVEITEASKLIYERVSELLGRSAVVRPTRDQLARTIQEAMGGAAGSRFPLSAAFYDAADAVLAVNPYYQDDAVSENRPTRDQLADVIADTMRAFDDDELTDAETEGEDWTLAEIIANVLARKYGFPLAEFWPGTPEPANEENPS